MATLAADNGNKPATLKFRKMRWKTEGGGATDFSIGLLKAKKTQTEIINI